jgi:hypothetical protein
VLLIGAVLGVAAISSDAVQQKGGGAQDRGQDQPQLGMQDKDRLHDRDRTRLQDPSKLKDEDIYGHKIMSPEELNRYRERLRLLKTKEERVKFEAQHREEMQKRAQALQIKIEDAE